MRLTNPSVKRTCYDVLVGDQMAVLQSHVKLIQKSKYCEYLLFKWVSCVDYIVRNYLCMLRCSTVL